MGSTDFDIRKDVIRCVGNVDPEFFQPEVLKALQDCNRQVRAAAASALLSGGRDLASALWRKLEKCTGSISIDR